MATVNFYFRGSKDQGSLTIRFIHTRSIDIKCSTNIVIPKKSWDQRKQRVRNVGEMKVAGKLNEKLLTLEASLVSKFNLDYMEGVDIDSNWLKKAVLVFFNRPTHELDKKEKDLSKIYLSDYCQMFCDTILSPGKWKDPKTKKPLAYKSVQHYKKTTEMLKDYEAHRDTRIKMKNLSLDFCEDFTKFLVEGTDKREGYSGDYPNKIIGRLKFFCRRAEEDNLDINKIYQSKMFSAPIEQTLDPYLDEQEIDKIFHYDFKDNERLDNARDWLIIGCHTGLRVSDFLGDKDWEGLSKQSIEDDLIHCENKKTGAIVTLPIHSKIKAILAKRDGDFPRKISSQKFNDYVKEVCEMVGIDQLIKASIKDKNKNRKVKGLYPKYKAVTSHICRRSFATNHYGKPGIATATIMKLGGWSTETAFMKYLKKSSAEHAHALQLYWDKEENKQIKNAS